MLLKQVSTIVSRTLPLHIPQCFHTWAVSHVIVLGTPLNRFTYPDAYFYMINRTSTYQVLGEFGLLLRCYLTSFLPCFLVGLIHAVAKRVPRMVFDDGALHGVCLIFLLADVLHGERKLGEKHALLSLTFTGTSLACYKLVCFWWLCMLSFLSSLVFGIQGCLPI